MNEMEAALQTFRITDFLEDIEYSEIYGNMLQIEQGIQNALLTPIMLSSIIQEDENLNDTLDTCAPLA